MTENELKINKCDKYLYVKDTKNSYVILCPYVDNMLIVCSNDKMIKSTKDMLNSRFDMKDIGLGVIILEIKIRTLNRLVLSQSHYVNKILRKFNKDDSGVARTLIDTSQYLSKNKGKSDSQIEYFRIIGSLMNLMICTRPNIVYIISKLSRYTSNPGVDH